MKNPFAVMFPQFSSSFTFNDDGDRFMKFRIADGRKMKIAADDDTVQELIDTLNDAVKNFNPNDPANFGLVEFRGKAGELQGSVELKTVLDGNERVLCLTLKHTKTGNEMFLEVLIEEIMELLVLCNKVYKRNTLLQAA